MSEKNKKNTIYNMVTCALMAALLCILCPMTIHIGPIPISLINFLVFLTVILLGGKWALVSYAVFFLLGLVGLPVFSGYSGGLAKIAGPTGGYIVGYFLTIPVTALFMSHSSDKVGIALTAVGMILGMAIAYVFGTVWYSIITSTGFVASLAVCVAPFVLIDLAKIAVALVLGMTVRSRLVKAHLLT
ncbi:MAG: biotin transporter BioY [Oscillospiraceae bacterium]|nr:biotin transporter BioY [Oscillospiraceae bacterium]